MPKRDDQPDSEGIGTEPGEQGFLRANTQDSDRQANSIQTESISGILAAVQRLARDRERLALHGASQARITDMLGSTLRSLDLVTPPTFRLAQLEIGASVANLFAGSSAISAMRNAMLANSRLLDQLTRPEWLESFSRIGAAMSDVRKASELAGMSASVARVASLRDFTIARPVEISFSRSMREWAAYVGRDTTLRTSLDVSRLESASDATLGMTSGVAIAGGSREAAEISDPWVEAPRETRAEMLARLAAIEPALVAKLDGAWDRIKRPGPDAAAQAATSLVEVIDWFLRLAAPDTEALRWHSSENRPELELHNGKPTRGLRIRFVLRSRGPDAGLASAYTDTTLQILAELQSMKHASRNADVAAIARLIPTVESVLTFVLL